jgi:hypothetical protein
MCPRFRPLPLSCCAYLCLSCACACACDCSALSLDVSRSSMNAYVNKTHLSQSTCRSALAVARRNAMPTAQTVPRTSHPMPLAWQYRDSFAQYRCRLIPCCQSLGASRLTPGSTRCLGHPLARVPSLQLRAVQSYTSMVVSACLKVVRRDRRAACLAGGRCAYLRASL